MMAPDASSAAAALTTAAYSRSVGRMFPESRRTLFWLLVLVTVLALAAPFMPEAARRAVFAEHRIVEWSTVALWFAAALLMLFFGRGSAASLAFCGVFLTFAAREADLGKALMPGISSRELMHLKYFLRADLPFLQRAIVALIMLALLISLVYSLFVAARYYLRQGGAHELVGQWLLAAALLLVASQVFERLFEWQRASNVRLATVCWALEELLECASPLLVIAALLSGRGRPFRKGSA